jgi:hypothetical protein
LSIAGNKLCITIPENWLSEAKYPVVVDPTIGTTTVGSQNTWNNDGEIGEFFSEYSLMVNRVTFPETMAGTAVAFVYVHNTDYEGTCQPVMYYDLNDAPLVRASASEGFFDIAVGGGKSPGWRSAPLSCGSPVVAGLSMWFGFSSQWFCPRFDYGAKCYWEDYYTKYGFDTPLPSLFPMWRSDRYFDFKLSMYLDYTAPKNYTRTVIQGATLADTRKLIGAYKRNAAQTAGVNSGTKRITQSKRSVTDIGDSGTVLSRKQNVKRHIAHRGNIGAAVLKKAEYLRGLFVEAGNMAEAKHTACYRRRVIDRADIAAVPLRHLFMFIRLLTGAYIREFISRRFLKSGEEVIIKSPVCREIILESRLH